MKLKLLALMMALMLLASPFAYTVYAEETSPDPPTEGGGETIVGGGDFNETEGAEGLNGTMPVDPEVLESLRNQTQCMYQQLLGYFGNATLPPAIMENFRHAQDAIEEGDSKNNTRAAAQMYLRAMMHFRNALRKHLHDNPDAVGDFEPGNATAPEPGLNATTSEEIEQAREELILRFQEQFRERLNLMYDNLDNLTGSLSDADALKARNTIQRAEEKLLRIQERIEGRDYDGALDDLDNATDSMDEGFAGMEDAFSGQMLRNMNKLEAKVQRMVEKQERKAAKGEDTGELDDIIGQLRGSINSSKNQVKSNRGNGGKPDDKGKPDNSGKGKSGH